jgi:exopolysaccharide/PEP-CTERM locus tyrosine autokinase
MTEHRPIKKATSSLERAADIFGTDPLANAPTIDLTGLPHEPGKRVRRMKVEAALEPAPVAADTVAAPAALKTLARAAPAIIPARHGTIDAAALADMGMIVPGSPVSGIAEEYRIVKRELIRNIVGGPGRPLLPRGHRVLIASANPGEGKTFSAINLALSLAAEADHDVILIDGDMAKPSIVRTLGLGDGPGLMDALADPRLPLGDCLIQTDLPRLKVMPSGQSTHGDSELLASARTEALFAALEAGAPGRILVIDSPPILAASPAAVLASHVGQLVMVVRADETLEASLRDAVGLVSACPHIQLLLNGVKFSPGGRRFGTYYGQGGGA